MSPRVNRKAPLSADAKRAVQKAKAVERERAFLRGCVQLGVPIPIPEFRFHPTRKHRLDYAWPDAKLGLEVEGGVWTRGKHGRGSGIVKDMEKANLLATAGWRLLRVVPAELPGAAGLVLAALGTPLTGTPHGVE